MRTKDIVRIVQTTLAALATLLASPCRWSCSATGGSTRRRRSMSTPWASRSPAPCRTQFDTAKGLKDYGLHVGDDIILINVNGNEYKGLVTVRTRKSTAVPFGVT